MDNVLIQIADELDQKGKHALADAIDEVIKSAARPKAPLKQLDDEVKKDLLKFLAKVKQNMQDSMEALEEFFRRLRYFDIADVVKELGLEKTLKEMEKTHDCMDNATKTMFALTHGKRPSRSDMEQLSDDEGVGEKSNPLDFFKSQHEMGAGLEEPQELPPEMPYKEDGMSNEGLEYLYEEDEDPQDVSEEDIYDFWQPESEFEDEE